jgi:hypothetical protein
METIAYELDILRNKVLFYKLMSGTFAKSMATNDDDSVDSIIFQEVQITAADQIAKLMNQGVESAQRWADVNVFSFRKKTELESKEND